MNNGYCSINISCVDFEWNNLLGKNPMSLVVLWDLHTIDGFCRAHQRASDQTIQQLSSDNFQIGSQWIAAFYS